MERHSETSAEYKLKRKPRNTFTFYLKVVSNAGEKTEENQYFDPLVLLGNM